MGYEDFLGGGRGGFGLAPKNDALRTLAKLAGLLGFPRV
jgi:hypothetical protein